MKKLLFLFLIGLLSSCNQIQKEKVYTLAERQEIDSIKTVLIKESEQRILEDSKISDTIGVYKSPLQDVRAKIIKSGSGNYRDVQLTYKNVGTQPITAMKFLWKGENAFLEPADMGNNFLKGYGSGFDDTTLNPGKTTTSTWSILSQDAKTIQAWPVEVVFPDNTKWLLEDFQ